MTDSNDIDDTDTIEVPREQFLKHMLPLIAEGNVEWQCSDEVREDISYREIADPSNVEKIRVDEDRVEMYGVLTKTVSEKVARRTHWHPAEYKNHEVEVWVYAVMPWPDGPYELPEGTVTVEQAEYPTEPPEPDVDAYRYDDL